MRSDEKLIAEFMGGKLTESLGQPSWDLPNMEGLQWVLFYDSSWDWLMPVVEKIEKFSYRIAITTFSVIIHRVQKDENPIIKFPSSKGDTFKREATYRAVVEYIKWYNQQSR